MQTATEQNPRWPVTVCTAKDCRAAVIWARTQSGSRALVNAAPTPDGRWLLVDTGEGPMTQYVAAALRGDPEYAGRLHVTHWATCSNPDTFRRKVG
jgi:hypothetical protein